MRRTSSLLFAIGEDPVYVMGQLGHRNPNFTLRVYAQEMARRDGERERLKALVEGRDFWERMGTTRESEGAPGSTREAEGTKNPLGKRLLRERLMGLEPTTFCMASRSWVFAKA